MAFVVPTARIAADRSVCNRLGSSFSLSGPFASKFLSSSSNSAGFRRKCTVQNALPGIAESLYSGLGVYTHDSMIKLHNVVLHGASHMGLPMPAQESTTWWWAVVAPAVLSYLFATPGTAAGLADFVYAPLHAHSFRSFSADDVEIGRQLGEGSFGVVYEGFFGRGGRKGGKSEGLHVVLKKAKTSVRGATEVHDSEIHMNYRLQRTASFACAEFLGTMQVKPGHARGKLSEGMWLVWNFQGDRSLDYYLKQRNFPENIVVEVLGDNFEILLASSKEEVFKRNAAVIRTIFKQILINLQDLHRSGVVHRDVKPLNLILDQSSGKFKFIDFGACVDLRSGFNFVPNETVIDPTYAAPEHYIMPTSTPHLPPDPLCSLVSPLFWHLNTPDRFDLYSAGLILMQLSMRTLRQDAGLQAFNTELKRSGYNLNTWRANCRHNKDEFAYLDADGGAGWELASALLQPRHDRDNLVWPSIGKSRPSASAALRHRFFNGSFVMPKISPKELQDPGVQVLPAFEDMAYKLSSAAKNVVTSNHKHVPAGLLLEQFKEKKGKLPLLSPIQEHINDKKGKVPGLPLTPVLPVLPQVFNVAVPDQQSSGLKNVKSKGFERHVGNAGLSRLKHASSPTSHILPSTSAVTEKLSHAIQGAFNVGPGKVKDKKDAVTRPQQASKVKPSLWEQEDISASSNFKKTDVVLSSIRAALPSAENLSVALQGAFSVKSGKVDDKKDAVAMQKPGSRFTEAKIGMPSNSEMTDTVPSAVGAALPTAATTAITLATGWLVLSGLNSSAQASYELGKLLMSSSGISGSAFLAFFLVIKPWLEEQGISLGKKEVVRDALVNENIHLEKYKSIHSEVIKVQMVAEAVQNLEIQLSSLEALMTDELQMSRQHEDLVHKMESLLLQPLALPQQDFTNPVKGEPASASRT